MVSLASNVDLLLGDLAENSDSDTGAGKGMLSLQSTRYSSSVTVYKANLLS